VINTPPTKTMTLMDFGVFHWKLFIAAAFTALEVRKTLI